MSFRPSGCTPPLARASPVVLAAHPRLGGAMGFLGSAGGTDGFTFQPPFLAGLSGYIAELGAAFLAADLGLAIEPRPDHASYIASWIKVLQNDARAIVQAAAHAERAVVFLHQVANLEEGKEAA